VKAHKLTTWLRKVFPRYEPFAHTVDYERRRRRDGHRREHLVNIGFFVHHLPRLVWVCRVFGHQPVVDGTRGHRVGTHVGPSHLWVRCGRCGERGHPQGSLDPQRWQIGQSYTGGWDVRPRKEIDWVAAAGKPGDDTLPRTTDPGPIGTHIDGNIGGELVIGGGYPGWGWEIKIGNRFSEHTLAAHLRLGRLGALYLHTEGFGMWLVTLLNRWEDTSKLVGFTIGDGRLTWQL
jgi:hypothetical protein